jgi:hypothetical protein
MSPTGEQTTSSRYGRRGFLKRRRPTFGSAGTFRMTDFLTFAGVDPATRHVQQPMYA